MNPEDLSIEELQKLLAEKQKSQQEEVDDNQPEASVGEDFTVSKNSSSRKGGKTPVVAGKTSGLTLASIKTLLLQRCLDPKEKETRHRRLS